jgi:nitroreductase
MDFPTLLATRRSIRDFRDSDVPLDLIHEILRDTMLAPTAGNTQPCRFIIVRDREFMKRLSDENKKNFLAELEKNPDSPLKQYGPILRDKYFNVFHNAPCLVFFAGSKAVRSLDVDCALTAAYFMFSAASRGLGTCWIGMGNMIRDGELLAELGLPDDHRIVAPVILGYPKAVPPASERHEPIVLKVI